VPVLEYLAAWYRRGHAEREASLWAILALASRIAPLSVIPVMLEYSAIEDADRYALMFANASVLSILLNFGQTSNMQARFSKFGLYSITVQGMSTATLIAIIGIAASIAIVAEPYFILTNIVFALAMALTAQYNILLRCHRDFASALIAEILRLVIFLASIAAAIKFRKVDFEFAAIVMIIYYALPYFIFLFRFRIVPRLTTSIISLVLEDRSRLSGWALSAFLSAAAWWAIRYMISLFGEAGDLARFSAILSICSAGVILADLLYTRIGRSIIAHIEGGRRDQIVKIAKAILPISALGFFAMLAASCVYIYFALDSNVSLMILSLLLSSGYFVRFYYVFGQQILIAHGTASYDLAGGFAMLGVALSASWLLVPEAGVIGAGVSFFLTAVTMLGVISWGVRKHWKAE